MMGILCKDECYAIQGAIFEVYKTLGNGFLEAVYQETLAIELKKAEVPFEEQVEIGIKYKDQLLKHSYRPDFVCYNSVIVEIKAVSKLLPEHEAQTLNYLKATGMKVGLLVNFGSYPKADIRRFVL